MKTYTTSYGQSILDVCLIVYGTLDKAVKLMFDNGLSYSTSLPAGTRLTYDSNTATPQLRFGTGF